jgi:SAM-dependent methyltransferase
MARDNPGDSWAAVAAALPQDARAERERPFWQALARSFGWRRVVDAGCGAGFHLRLLRAVGVNPVGFDAALAALTGPVGAPVIGGDLLHPPLADGTFDAVLCLGNTFSLLASRALQREGLAALAGLLRPGGIVLLQGEHAGALARETRVLRTRRLDSGAVHVRVFERVGRRVRMLAGVARDGVDAPLAATWLLPTSARVVTAMARALGLRPVALPAPPPGAGTAWWRAFSAPSP